MSIKPYRILASGIDTIDLAIDINWEKESFFNYLESMKELAVFEDRECAIAIKDKRTEESLWTGVIKPFGTKGYEWNLNSVEFSLLIGNWYHPKSKPSILARISSEFIWTEGPETAVNFLLNLLTHAGATIRSVKASRVDLCIDIPFPTKRWLMGLINNRVTRACYAAPHFYNNNLTGISIGKGKISARLYNKALEIEQKSKKYWMYEVWGIDTIPDKFKIIRIEYQLRREVIKDLGLDSIFSVLAHCDNLWAYCTKQWLKFQNNPGKHHTQRKTFGWWKIVQDSFLGVQNATPLIRTKAISPKKDMLASLAYGAFRSFIALSAEEHNLPMDHPASLKKAFRYMGEFIKKNEKNDFRFSIDVHDKRAKYHRTSEKMIEANRQREILGFPFAVPDNTIIQNVRSKKWKKNTSQPKN